MSGELFPVVLGVLTGLVVGLAAPRARVWIGAVLAIAFGVLATFLTGESEISWAFLLIDIPLVAVGATATFLLLRRLRIGSWTVEE